MKSMKLKFDTIKGQKFDIKRTINLSQCTCEKCDFLHCPKNNYAVRVKRHRYTVDEYIDYYSEELKKFGFLTYELLDEFMDLFNFPKGTYWRRDYDKTHIEFVTFNRKGDEICKGSINARTGVVLDYDLTEPQYKLACRIGKGIKQVYEFIESEWVKQQTQI